MVAERVFPKDTANEVVLTERDLLASIVESSDDSIVGKSLDGTILSWNAAAEIMYGFSAEEAIGQSILILVPPDRKDEIPRILARIRNGEIVQHYETKRMDKAGGQIDVSVTVSPIKNPSGEIVGASSITRDISDQKRVEEALQRASAYSRSLIEASLDPLVTISAEGKVTDVNTATERVTGCSRNELIGTDFADYFTDPEKARAGYQQAFRDGSVRDYELEIRHRGAGLTPVMYNASVYRDESGRIIGLFAAARDITESKRAEKALQVASAYNRSLIEASLDPLVTISAEGKITDVNTGTERVTGRSREELIGTDFADYFTDPEKARAGYQQVFRDGLVKDYELEIRHRDGGLTPVMYNASVYRDESGEIIGLFAAARDITESKRAEKALQVASAYNRSLIEASLDPLVTISAEGKITDVNTGTERVTGRSRDELIGTDFDDYFTDPEKARSGYQKAFADGSVRDYELEIRHKNGSLTPVMYNAAVYRDESGEIVGLFAAARDISDFKQAEKLTAYARDLERANAELEQFAYAASHDLQEPLRKLTSFSELLREDLGQDLPQAAASDLDFITDAAARMQTLVLDLLALSRIGKAAVKYEKIPLQECADAAMANLSRKIEETGAEIIRDPLPVVLGDHTLLTQLYQNLIGNSLHYRAGERPRIHLTCEKTKDGWVLGVLDNGIGIQPEYLDHIFLPFKRLHTRQKYEGTGVGLSICRRVVNLSGGHIWAESEGENKGAHFKFTLKRLKENQQ